VFAGATATGASDTGDTRPDNQNTELAMKYGKNAT
jgi:hypothetical protein